MSVRVIMDERFGFGDAATLPTSDRARCVEWVGNALDEGVATVVVVGDDSSLSALATAYLEQLRGRVEPLRFLPLAAGHIHSAVDSVGNERATSRTVANALRKVERGEVASRRVATLRVVDSTMPSARLAFGFGMGVNELLDASHRSRRRDAIKQALRTREWVDAEVIVDWVPTASKFGYLVASSVSHGWAGLEMGDGPTMRLGNSPLDLVRGATRVGRVLERATGTRAVEFRRIHIDTNNDYVVDGMPTPVSRPRVVAVTPGPTVHVLATS